MAGPDSTDGEAALASAESIVGFWREGGPRRWFARNDAFDAAIRERFEPTRAAAARGALDGWRNHALGALALILVLDQFPRNLFRGSPKAFATDALARGVAREAIGRGFDQSTSPDLRLFFYLPLSHSESLDDQDLAMRLTEALEAAGGPDAGSAREHRDIIRRFGRFPHRNATLGRASTAEELAFLAAGGFRG